MSTDLVPVRVLDRDGQVAELVRRWLKGQTSPHTRRAYTADINLWITYCAEGADGVIDPLRARHYEVKDWINDRIEAGDSEATRARRLASLSSWYRWLLRERHALVEYNPADLDKKERPAVDRHFSPTMALSGPNTEALVSAADADRNPRSAAIIGLLLYDGLRIAELAAADAQDIDYGSGHPLLLVHGKGRRERIVPIPPPALVRWQRYDASRLGYANLLPALAAGGAGNRPLIATKKGGRLTQGEVWRLLRRLGREGGLPDEVVARLSPHVLRHTCATLLLANGEPLHKVQRFLGHADASTTGRYDHTEHDPDNSPAYKLMTLLNVRATAEGSSDSLR